MVALEGGEGPGLDQVPEELLEEEGIPLGFAMEGRRDFGWDLVPGEIPEHVGTLGLGEPPQRDARHRRLARKVCEQVRDRGTAGEVDVPIAEDQQQRRGWR